MTVEEQNSVVRQYIDAWNKQDLAAVGDLLLPDFIRHDANLPDVEGAQAELEFIASVVKAFPDLDLNIDQLITQDNFVVVRLAIRGTHENPFMGVPATRRSIDVKSMEIIRLAEGKIAEQWVVMDLLSFFQQLGVVPGIP